MTTKQGPSGRVLRFVNFVMSEEGAKILKDIGNMGIKNK
jgi:hypothetical protein